MRKRGAIFIPTAPIRQAVEASGLSVREVAKLAGVGPGTLAVVLSRPDMSLRFVHAVLQAIDVMPVEIGV